MLLEEIRTLLRLILVDNLLGQKATNESAKETAGLKREGLGWGWERSSGFQ